MGTNNATGDPLDQNTIDWWTDKLAEIYDNFPTLGGVLIKADSEGNVGPATFNRTQAEGANMLAKIIKPNNGRVIWRAFIYGDSIGSDDLARQATDTFVPLDGLFDDNVIIQIKNGPYDFQIREPLQPLIGALKKTNIMMEVQATQEYTGQQIHAVSLVKMWEHYLKFDTLWEEDGGSTVGKLISGVEYGGKQSWGGGMSCVSNVGNMGNWTGNIIAGSNTFGFGKVAWDPINVDADAILNAWTSQTFEAAFDDNLVATLQQLVAKTWPIYEGYYSPLGMGFIIAQNNPYGCAPKTDGPGLGPTGNECTPVPQKGGGRGAGNDHYWADPCPSYDFENATSYGIGCDRTVGGKGSEMVELYSPAYQTILNNITAIDENLLLFFHNLPWDYVMEEGSDLSDDPVTILDFIDDRSKYAISQLEEVIAVWKDVGAGGAIDGERYDAMLARFAQQYVDSQGFRENIVGYFRELAGR